MWELFAFGLVVLQGAGLTKLFQFVYLGLSGVVRGIGPALMSLIRWTFFVKGVQGFRKTSLVDGHALRQENSGFVDTACLVGDVRGDFLHDNRSIEGRTVVGGKFGPGPVGNGGVVAQRLGNGLIAVHESPLGDGGVLGHSFSQLSGSFFAQLSYLEGFVEAFLTLPEAQASIFIGVTECHDS